MKGTSFVAAKKSGLGVSPMSREEQQGWRGDLSILLGHGHPGVLHVGVWFHAGDTAQGCQGPQRWEVVGVLPRPKLFLQAVLAQWLVAPCVMPRTKTTREHSSLRMGRGGRGSRAGHSPSALAVLRGLAKYHHRALLPHSWDLELHTSIHTPLTRVWATHGCPHAGKPREDGGQRQLRAPSRELSPALLCSITALS